MLTAICTFWWVDCCETTWSLWFDVLSYKLLIFKKVVNTLLFIDQITIKKPSEKQTYNYNKFGRSPGVWIKWTVLYVAFHPKTTQIPILVNHNISDFQWAAEDNSNSCNVYSATACYLTTNTQPYNGLGSKTSTASLHSTSYVCTSKCWAT